MKHHESEHFSLYLHKYMSQTIYDGSPLTDTLLTAKLDMYISFLSRRFLNSHVYWWSDDSNNTRHVHGKHTFRRIKTKIDITVILKACRPITVVNAVILLTGLINLPHQSSWSLFDTTQWFKNWNAVKHSFLEMIYLHLRVLVSSCRLNTFQLNLIFRRMFQICMLLLELFTGYYLCGDWAWFRLCESFCFILCTPWIKQFSTPLEMVLSVCQCDMCLLL